jgi:hypothetical protein
MVSADTFTASVPKRLIETRDFIRWKNGLDKNTSRLIGIEIEKIMLLGLITSVKSLREGLYEKKFKTGLRFYFSVIKTESGLQTLLLHGSRKGRKQEGAIFRAKKELYKFDVYLGNLKFGDV